jgi:hypothetical protein
MWDHWIQVIFQDIQDARVSLKSLNLAAVDIHRMSQNEIAVNIPQNLDPVYSNMIQIAYKDDEFTFVFLHQIPGINQARAKAIVSITPQHAKNLLAVFTKTFADYESKFGKIELHQGKTQSESVTTIRGYS